MSAADRLRIMVAAALAAAILAVAFTIAERVPRLLSRANPPAVFAPVIILASFRDC